MREHDPPTRYWLLVEGQSHGPFDSFKDMLNLATYVISDLGTAGGVLWMREELGAPADNEAAEDDENSE